MKLCESVVTAPGPESVAAARNVLAPSRPIWMASSSAESSKAATPADDSCTTLDRVVREASRSEPLPVAHIPIGDLMATTGNRTVVLVLIKACVQACTQPSTKIACR